jgi:hypothetical protein
LVRRVLPAAASHDHHCSQDRRRLPHRLNPFTSALRRCDTIARPSPDRGGKRESGLTVRREVPKFGHPARQLWPAGAFPIHEIPA